MDVCFIDGTVLTLPSDGGTLELGRGRPECLTDPHLSRRQCWLRTFPGQTRVELRAVATNAPLIVEELTEPQGGESGWHVIGVVEPGDALMLEHNMRFFLSSRKETTTITLRASSLLASQPLHAPLTLRAPQPMSQAPTVQPNVAIIGGSTAGNGGGSTNSMGQGAKPVPVPSHSIQRYVDLSADAPEPKRMRVDTPQIFKSPPRQQADGAQLLQARNHSDVPFQSILQHVRPATSVPQYPHAAASGQQAPSPMQPSPPHRAAAPAGAAAAPAGSGCRPPSSAAHVVPGLAESPISLFRVQRLPNQAMNVGCMGASLSQLVAGQIHTAIVVNYMIDMPFLLSMCPDLARSGQMLVVHGEGGHGGDVIAQMQATKPPQAVLHRPPLPIPYGTHHSKAFLLQYATGLRVIVHTANLIYPDCNNKSQGLWWQDFPRKRAGAAAGAAACAFEETLQRYLAAYQIKPAQTANAIHAMVAAHDFSGARGALVCSVPGYHQGADIPKWGHMALRTALSKVSLPPGFEGVAPRAHNSSSKDLESAGSSAGSLAGQMTHGSVSVPGSSLVAQFSSLGKVDEEWLLGEFGRSLAASAQGPSGTGSSGPLPSLPPPATRPGGRLPLQLVWPTAAEVRDSLEGWPAGQSIPGPRDNVTQPFLQAYWSRWGGEVAGREAAMPHIKTYARHQGSRLAWFLVASHNLSKAAWGAMAKNGKYMIRSYELGVLTTPHTELAYRTSPNKDFCCTPQRPGGSTAAAPLPAAALAAAGGGADCVDVHAVVELWSMQELWQMHVPVRRTLGGAHTAGANRAGVAADALPSTPAAAAAAAALARAERCTQGGLQEPSSAMLASPVAQKVLVSEPSAINYTAAGACTASSTGLTPAATRVYIPVPYSLPPQRYQADDLPWNIGTLFPGLDSHGMQLGQPAQLYGNLQD